MRKRGVEPVEPTSLWDEFVSREGEKAVAEFIAGEEAQWRAEYLALPTCRAWYRPCPKCGLDPQCQHPKFDRGGPPVDFEVYARRDNDGTVSLHSAVRIDRFMCEYDASATKNVTFQLRRYPRVTVTCECGHLIGKFRPNDCQESGNERS